MILALAAHYKPQSVRCPTSQHSTPAQSKSVQAGEERTDSGGALTWPSYRII